MWITVRVKLSDLMFGPDGRPISTRALSPKAAAKICHYGSHQRLGAALAEAVQEPRLLLPTAPGDLD